jgi:hypothetical protein
MECPVLCVHCQAATYAYEAVSFIDFLGVVWQVSLPGEPLGMYLVHNHSIFSVCYGCAKAHDDMCDTDVRCNCDGV